MYNFCSLREVWTGLIFLTLDKLLNVFDVDTIALIAIDLRLPIVRLNDPVYCDTCYRSAVCHVRALCSNCRRYRHDFFCLRQPHVQALQGRLHHINDGANAPWKKYTGEGFSGTFQT